MSRRRVVSALIFGVLYVVTVTVTITPVTATATGSGKPTRPVRWLAAGDSYSSGEGLPDVAEPNCQRADRSGQHASAAWAVVARDQLGADLPLADGTGATGGFDFVACTGAVTEDLFDNAKGKKEWDANDNGRFDLVTFSFGGNNVGFADILKQCIGATIPAAVTAATQGLLSWISNVGCPPEDDMRRAVDGLVNGGNDVDGRHLRPYADFLRDVATRVVTPGGNIVVTGYPELIEDPQFWPFANKAMQACQGIRLRDAGALRGVAALLNQTIGQAVATVDAEHVNGVHLTFVDVNTGQPDHGVDLGDQNLFEPNHGDRHNLCAAHSWLNGLTTGLTSGQFRYERSFHPTQEAHDHEGALVAGRIRQLDWSGLAGNGAPRLAIATTGGVAIWSSATGSVVYSPQTSSDLFTYGVTWSTDGRFVAWVQRRPTTTDTVLVRLDTFSGRMQSWTTTFDPQASPIITPDGLITVGLRCSGRCTPEAHTYTDSGETAAPINGGLFVGAASFDTGWVLTYWDVRSDSAFAFQRAGLDGNPLPGGYGTLPPPGPTGQTYNMSIVDRGGKLLATELGDHTDTCGVGPNSSLWVLDLTTNKASHSVPDDPASPSTSRFWSMAFGPNDSLTVVTIRCQGSDSPDAPIPTTLWEYVDGSFHKLASDVLGAERGPNGQLAVVVGTLSFDPAASFPVPLQGGLRQVTVDGTPAPTALPAEGVVWAP